MAALVCDICGGKLVMGAGGIAVCDSCGMEHSADRMKEKVQEITGTVRVDNTHMITNYLGLAASALKAGNNEEAENYANKILEIDPRSDKAWFYKGKAVGWESSLQNFRFMEVALCFANAVNSTNEASKRNMINDVLNEFQKLTSAMVKTRCNRFVKWPDQKESEGFCTDLQKVSEALDLYTNMTGMTINRNEVFSNVTVIVVDSITSVYSGKITPDFIINFGRKAYGTFVERIGYCVRILEKAADLCDDDETLDAYVYKTIITLLESVIESNCTDFVADQFGAYKETPRLSNSEVQTIQSKINELRSKISNTKGAN